MNDHELIYTKESIEFATVAKEFLAFLESASKMTKEDFIDTSVKLLPLLYLKGVLLPEVNEFDDDFTEKFVTESTWTYIQQIAAAKLDEDDIYVQIQDAGVVNSTDYLNVGLSELFADLYQETGDFIGAYRTGTDEIMLAALYYCRENFKNYWGIRILVLIKHLHEIKYKITEDFDF
ncbi:MAG: DUF5063 domain-containing protein [Bacteroidales bacterium]|jgi:hypothetical protein|nr:DUF5063 domain-containing protein [Bacteroidales bacterium]